MSCFLRETLKVEYWTTYLRDRQMIENPNKRPHQLKIIVFGILGICFSLHPQNLI